MYEPGSPTLPTEPAGASIVRVIAPAGSLRQQFVLTRVAAAVAEQQRVLLVNVNPLRELYFPTINAMGGRVVTPTGCIEPPTGDGANLLYVTLAEENNRFKTDPAAALVSLHAFVSEDSAPGAMLIVDGLQALTERGKVELLALAKVALAHSYTFVAIGSKSVDTECLAELAEKAVKLPSKYDLAGTYVNPDWLLASRAWSPTQTDLLLGRDAKPEDAY